MPSQARPADSSTEADNQTKLLLGLRALFSLLVPFLAGWRFISRSLLLSFSFTPFCLIIIVIPYEIIRGYILSASASLLTVLIIPICSVFPPCLVLTSLAFAFASSSLMAVQHTKALILFCCLPTLYINLIPTSASPGVSVFFSSSEHNTHSTLSLFFLPFVSSSRVVGLLGLRRVFP